MAITRTIRQYGLWDSPILPVSLARSINFSDVAWGEDGTLAWREQRGERGVIVLQPPDGQSPRDLNSDYSARARVGYGGGDFSLGGGNVYFVEAETGRIYRQPVSQGVARPITPKFGFAAAPTLSPDGRWLLYVHTDEGKDVIAIVDSEGKSWPAKLVSGADFYMQPGWHPDGRRVAWIAWNHPQMPWDGTLLQLAALRNEDSQPGQGLPALAEVVTIAGGENISIFQPQFSPDGRYLAYVSDQTGWWQFTLYDLQTEEHLQVTEDQAEYGQPAWAQGQRTYTFSPDGRFIYILRSAAGFTHLLQIDLASRAGSAFRQKILPLGDAYTWFSQPAISPDGEKLALIASGGSVPPRVITVNLPSKGDPQVRVARRSASEELPPAAYAPAQPITWSGLDGGLVHGLFYASQNESFEGRGLPPLIVYIHGGPTSQRTATFNPQAQFFTSRGYAVLEVNYRGSTGYGRAYRDALRGNWGIYDVQDAISGARSLGEEKKVDPSRLVIMGGSAGGFTVLKALEDYPGFFKAGICLYGVSNQFTLAAETHKFEARYSDSLLGPLPEAAEIYRERSPIFFADRIQDPVAIFQGEVDNVVPRSQSDAIVDSLRRRGVPHEYQLYPGEGHGFRKPETIEHFNQTVEKFLRQYVIFS